MSFLQAIVLGIVQGLTEFVPVSSTGHLVITPWLLGWPQPGLAFDTILHLGTLVAVLFFFHADLRTLLEAWSSSLRSRTFTDPRARVAWLIVLATVPAACVGAAFGSFFEGAFSSPRLVGIFLIGTAIILVSAERLTANSERLGSLGWAGALAVGLAQAVAILPGVSRSGATIAAGLAVGLKRTEAARFSFLLSIPIIMAAGGSQLMALARQPQGEAEAFLLAAGFLSAAVSGYLAIGFLMRYLRERSLYVFAGYAAVAGAGTIILSLIR